MDRCAARLPLNERLARLHSGAGFSQWLVAQLAVDAQSSAADAASHYASKYSTHPALPDRLAALPPDATEPQIDAAPAISLLAQADTLAARLITRIAAKQDHIWWGVSVENKQHGLPRIDLLRSAPAQVRFLSIEPLLEDLGTFNLDGIAWAIVGGESGPGARPMKPEWVHNIRRQCKKAKVAFFFKQWGGVRKSETGRELDGKTYSEFPERTNNEAPSLADRRGVWQKLESELAVA